jgi:hypothetical protein
MLAVSIFPPFLRCLVFHEKWKSQISMHLFRAYHSLTKPAKKVPFLKLNHLTPVINTPHTHWSQPPIKWSDVCKLIDYCTGCIKKKVIELQRAIIRVSLSVWTIGFQIRKDQAFSYWMACTHTKWRKNKHVRGRSKMLVKIAYFHLSA